MAENKNPNTATLAAEILAGEYDGDHGNIIAAVLKRQQSGMSQMRWKLVLGDIEVTEDDMTLAEAKTVERLTGLRWVTIDPKQSAAHMSAVLVAAAHHRLGEKLNDAEDRVDAHTTVEILDALEQYEVNPSPLGSGESSTSEPTKTDAPSPSSSEASAP